MKILYVKNNSERAKNFQLRTIIYQKDSIKYVKKVAACKEAIPHLKKMKNSYTTLKASIINPKIKLAKIIDEDESSLTFEFIDGESFQKKLHRVISKDGEYELLINEYLKLIESGFKTTLFDSSNMATDKFRKLFGNLPYSEMDGEVCFDGTSNIDFVFSNIISRGEDIYLIDYEWVYEHSIPLKYILFRSMLYTILLKDRNNYNNSFYTDMEDSLMSKVFLDSFQIYRKNYLKNSYKFENIIQEKDLQLNQLNSSLEDTIQKKDQYIEYLQDLAQSLRLKNRLIRAAKKITFRK